MGLLVGLGQDGAGGHAEGAALVAPALVGPHLGDGADVFVPGFFGFVGVGVHAAEFGPGGGASGAEFEASVAEDVEHGGALGDADGVVELGDADDDAVSDADLLGLHGAGGEEEFGR